MSKNIKQMLYKVNVSVSGIMRVSITARALIVKDGSNAYHDNTCVIDYYITNGQYSKYEVVSGSLLPSGNVSPDFWGCYMDHVGTVYGRTQIYINSVSWRAS